MGTATGAGLSALTVALPLWFLVDCRSPTQVTLALTTDTCAVGRAASSGASIQLPQTSITLGSPGSLPDAPVAVTSDCSGVRIGTLVLLPGASGNTFEVEVVTGVTVPASQCSPGNKGCIFERRILTFIDHTPLELPVSMLADCEGIVCGSGETCSNGRCVPDTTVCSSGVCNLGAAASDAGVDASDAQGDANDARASSPPSCAGGGPGQSNCGTTSDESCCTTLFVEGGTYYRSYTSQPDGGPTPGTEADPATVSSFNLDKYLVTVGRFRPFQAAVMATDAGPGAGGYAPVAGSGKHSYLDGGGLVNVTNCPTGGPADIATCGTLEPGWLPSDDSNVVPTTANLTSTTCVNGDLAEPTWTDAPASNENFPIVCVNWAEAYAFCIWDGGFLPSEAELEYAEAGGDDQREFPWGSTLPTSCCGLVAYDSRRVNVGTAVLGAGRWGQLDLAGEVWEYPLDLDSTFVNPCTNCANIHTGTSIGGARPIHGGNFVSGAPEYWTPPERYSWPPLQRDWGVGFRCARAP